VNDGNFEPERLRLARELGALSQKDLADRIGLTPAAVSQFEAGVTAPSLTTMVKMAAELGVPEAFLELPIDATTEGFFRSLRRTSVGHRRQARALAHLAHDVAAAAPPDALAPTSVPSMPVVDLDAPRRELEKIAGKVRAQLRLPRGPIENMVGLLESMGVVVVRLPMKTSDVDAFSLPFHDRPVVVLSADKKDRARSRFDAAHELGHLVIHGDQVWGLKEVEDQAHRFAAAFLMPERDIIHELPTRADWPALFDLKRKWQVSLAALLMRARTLEKMSEAQYIAAVKSASARGWRRAEPVPLGQPERPTHFEALLAAPAVKTTLSALPSAAVGDLVEATAA
jgi:Zn-dependent peptidase ImmA (M78 family)/transcriptional regulator with XRE-family HTH domain